jgi:hypothetical protein
MTRDIRKNINEEIRVIPENLNCSGYTMAAVAAGLLFCVGIIVYALLTA